MKRSKMEQLIFEELLKSCPEEASMNLAERLLQVCEEAGMMPPNIEEVEPDYEINMFLPTYEWEKEG